ncbi:Histone specific chaperone chz1 [Fusarium acuminatum]|uniref:Histone specific chaperone chz1 n=1 Tax=Fusarium acuminatum TaxID=5515 RepID=A0ABZ2WFQ9_9HYPO
MSDNSATIPQDSAMDQDHSFAEEKGKGKAPAEHITEDSAMDEDDDDDSDDEDEEVRFPPPALYYEDGLEEIDLNNIVQGGRTRGAQIDFAKAAEQHPADDEDEEDDEDFQPAEDTKMSE